MTRPKTTPKKRPGRPPIEYGRLAVLASLPYDAELMVRDDDGKLLPVTTSGDAVEVVMAHLGGSAMRALARLRKAVTDQRVRAIRLDAVRCLYVLPDVERVAQVWAAQEDARAPGW